jgi:hypothetical protein
LGAREGVKLGHVSAEDFFMLQSYKHPFAVYEYFGNYFQTFFFNGDKR